VEAETNAPPTPVLALTAHAFADMVVKGKEIGFTEILTKPIRQAWLLASLAKYNRAEQPQFYVTVEEGMEDVVPGYLEKRRAEVPVYRNALRSGDLAAIAGLAHKMKGTGSGYGFDKLTELGSAIERAARAGDAAPIGPLLDELSQYLNSVHLVGQAPAGPQDLGHSGSLPKAL
jgi:hypothetical protein